MSTIPLRFTEKSLKLHNLLLPTILQNVYLAVANIALYSFDANFMFKLDVMEVQRSKYG